MAQIILDHVDKTYAGGVKAIDDLSLDVKDGEFMAFVGPSGCGKSTALRSIAGLEEITAGKIQIGDRVVNDLPPKDRDIAMVFQNYALYPHMTVEQNLAFGLQLRKTPKDEIKRRVDDAAKMLGLEQYLNRKPVALSGGQRQRVAMGRAIVREPQAFLTTPPTQKATSALRLRWVTGGWSGAGERRGAGGAAGVASGRVPARGGAVCDPGGRPGRRRDGFLGSSGRRVAVRAGHLDDADDRVVDRAGAGGRAGQVNGTRMLADGSCPLPVIICSIFMSCLGIAARAAEHAAHVNDAGLLEATRRYVAQAAADGRVPVPEEAVVFTVRLPVRLAAAVREHARTSGRTVSSVAAQALDEFLGRAHGNDPRR
jgi:ABC-type lipoprotein export system ATPase subunit